MTDGSDVTTLETTSTEVVPQMTHDEAVDCTERIRTAYESINTSIEKLAEMMYEAQTKGAWKILGYHDWETYVTTEFRHSRTKSYALIDRHRLMLALGDGLEGSSIDMPALANALANEDSTKITNDEMRAIRHDEGIAEVVSVVKGHLETAPNAEVTTVAKVVKEAAQTAKAKKTRTKTPVHVDTVEAEPEDAEVVDGEIVVDDKSAHLAAVASRLCTILEQLTDFPEPEEIAPYIDDYQMDRIIKARMWLSRFMVEIPA